MTDFRPTLIESIDTELQHLRKRVGQVFFYSFLIEILLITGNERINLTVDHGVYSVILYSFIYLIVPFIVYKLSNEYLRRIIDLKINRERISGHTDAQPVYPIEKNQTVNEIHGILTVLLILSVIGLSVAWANHFQVGEAETRNIKTLYKVESLKGLNLRVSPDISANVVHILERGEMVIILETFNEWVKVDTDGDGQYDGYCYKSYLIPMNN